MINDIYYTSDVSHYNILYGIGIYSISRQVRAIHYYYNNLKYKH